jgi:hypothetical protein
MIPRPNDKRAVIQRSGKKIPATTRAAAKTKSAIGPFRE